MIVQRPRALTAVKRAAVDVARDFLVGSRLPIAVQKFLIDRLPLGAWPKSLAYQQCLADRILRRHGAVVQAGPFKGMKYLSDAHEGCIVPKLLGCYEEELAPAIEDLLRTEYDRVIDIGTAAGFYVVGLARRLPNAEVFGFEVDPDATRRCKELIDLNGVQARVKLGGFCTPAKLNEIIRGRTLLVVDCEGGEYELLDQQAAPNLRHCDLIVEMHDFINPKISSTLESRFQDSHSIERISSKSRRPSLDKYPALQALGPKHWDAATHERRPCTMEWFVLRHRL